MKRFDPIRKGAVQSRIMFDWEKTWTPSSKLVQVCAPKAYEQARREDLNVPSELSKPYGCSTVFAYTPKLRIMRSKALGLIIARGITTQVF